MPGDPAVGRLRRARAALSAALFVHGATFGLVVFAVAGGSVRQVEVAVLAATLVVVPSVVLLWWERRQPISRRPGRWMRRASATAVPHSVGFGLAAAALDERVVWPAWQQVALLACGVLLLEVGAVGLASRALLRPLTPELGEMDVEVLVKIRSDAEWLPTWLSHDDVRLTEDSLIITVRPNSRWAFVDRIGLDDVVEVRIRPTTAGDGPWFVTDGGRMFWPPSGELVVIEHRHGSRSVPVHDPEGFAAVVRARVRRHASVGNSPTVTRSVTRSEAGDDGGRSSSGK